MAYKKRPPITEKQKIALDAGRIPWVKGQSGNPKGKPPGTKSRSTFLKLFGDCTFVDKNGKPRFNPFTPGTKQALLVEEMMDLAMVKEAMKGNVAAWKEIKDSMYGKVKEVHEIIPGDVTKKEVDEMSEEEASQLYDSLAKN